VPDQQLDLQQQPGIGIVEAHAEYLFRPPDPVAQWVRVDVQIGGGRTSPKRCRYSSIVSTNAVSRSWS
jgi:hypothetical protein